MSSDLESALSALNENIAYAIDELGKLLSGEYEAPWISNELRLLIRKQEAVKRCYQRKGDVTMFSELFRLSEEVDDRLDQS